jgi:ribose transport system ATP-binding protein
MPMSLAENLSIANVRRYWRRAWLSKSAERSDAREDVAQLHIRAPGLSASMYQLSGGNQQKAILARWFRRDTRVLLLDEPTVGVDISSRAEIYRVIRAAADGGTSVILVSSDYEELAGVCDRVVVMADGRIVGEGRPPAIDRHWIAEKAHKANAQPQPVPEGAL